MSKKVSLIMISVNTISAVVKKGCVH